MQNSVIYGGRNEDAHFKLDAAHFNAVSDPDLWFLGGPLDAPDWLPAGSVRDHGNHFCWVRMSTVSRPDMESLHADRKALATELIAKMAACFVE